MSRLMVHAELLCCATILGLCPTYAVRVQQSEVQSDSVLQGVAAREMDSYSHQQDWSAEDLRKAIYHACDVVMGRQKPDNSKNSPFRRVTAVPWAASVSVMDSLHASCAHSITAKDLGESESSSKSGALFWKCGTLQGIGSTGTELPPAGKTEESFLPQPGDQPDFRVIVKGGIRNSRMAGTPEWELFTNMTKEFSGDYMQRSMLNRVVMGFKAFGLRWFVLEDVGADGLLAQIQKETDIHVVGGPMNFKAFDIKPSGSRAPSLPGCFQEIERVTDAMSAPLQEWINWDYMHESLMADMALMSKYEVVDESLFIQVSGPFAVNATATFMAMQETALLNVFRAQPKCAYTYKMKQEMTMAVVCITVIDYFLPFGTFRNQIQNTFQGNRWTGYSHKIVNMFRCLGQKRGMGKDCEAYDAA